MSRVPAIAITLHWSAVFSLLTIMAIFPGEASPSGIMLFGTGNVPVPEHGAKLFVAGFALLFALCAVLFLWALATTIWADRDDASENADVAEKAFATASVAMTIVLAYGLSRSQTGLIPTMGINYAALVVSFLALRVDRPSAARKRERAVAAAVKARAMEASHSWLLAGLVPARAEIRKEQR